MEHPAGQLSDPALQRLPAVLVPEEFGVGEPGAEHPLVTGDDLAAAVASGGVGNDDEAGREPAPGINQREILLVRAHRGHQHLGRHVHELAVDMPDHDRRPLDEADHLVEQRRIGAERQVFPGRQPLSLAQDQPPPLLRVDHDGSLGKRPDIIVAGSDLDVAGAEEAVASGRLSRRHRPEPNRQRSTVEPAQEPVQRPHPTDLVLAPAHRLGPRQRPQRPLQHLGNHRAGVAALTFDDGEQEPPFAGVALFERGPGDAGAAQKAPDRRFRRIGPWPAPFLDGIRLGQRQAVDDQRQPPWGDEPARLRKGEGGFGKACADEPLQIGRRLRLHPRRNFLGQDLEQQLRHDLRPPHAEPPA